MAISRPIDPGANRRGSHRRFASKRYGVTPVMVGSNDNRCSSGGNARLRQSGRSHRRQDKPIPTLDRSRSRPSAYTNSDACDTAQPIAITCTGLGSPHFPAGRVTARAKQRAKQRRDRWRRRATRRPAPAPTRAARTRCARSSADMTRRNERTDNPPPRIVSIHCPPDVRWPSAFRRRSLDQQCLERRRRYRSSAGRSRSPAFATSRPRSADERSSQRPAGRRPWRRWRLVPG
jgi:hypothetical protein